MASSNGYLSQDQCFLKPLEEAHMIVHMIIIMKICIAEEMIC